MHTSKTLQKSNYKDWHIDINHQYVGIPHFLKHYCEVKQER